MNLKCLFGFHDWKKIGGPKTGNHGEVKQKYRCERCGDLKTEIH